MNCRKVSSSLSAYIDGELAGVEHRMIFDHLAFCSDCADEYEGLLKMKRMVSMLKIREPLASLPTSIINRVEEERQHPRSWLHYQFGNLQEAVLRPASPSQLAAGAGFAVLCVILLGNANRHQDKIEWGPLHTGGIASLESSSRTIAQMQSPMNGPLQFADPAAFSTASWGDTIPGFQPVQSPSRDSYFNSNPRNQMPSNHAFKNSR